MLECITPVVMDVINESLLVPITEQEIWAAARQMEGLKAPGPNGF